MIHNLIFVLVFLNSIFISESVVHNWNFYNSALDLLSESDSLSFKVIEETTNDLYAKLYKYIAKENGEVVYRKYLTMYYNSEPIFKEQVDFDDIESYHRFDDDNIIISKGKYHPIYFYDGFLSSLGFSPFNDNGDCELQCITHEKWIFYVCLFNEW